jgi:transcription elongation factor Elf1
MTKKVYTVHDVIKAGYTLEPLKCIHCGHIGEVTFNQYIGDASCGMCGKWQLEDEEF